MLKRRSVSVYSSNPKPSGTRELHPSFSKNTIEKGSWRRYFVDRHVFRLKWILLLFAVFFLMGQFFLNSSAYAEWTVVDPPSFSSFWELSNVRYNWAVGYDPENTTAVLLYLAYGS